MGVAMCPIFDLALPLLRCLLRPWLQDLSLQFPFACAPIDIVVSYAAEVVTVPFCWWTLHR